MEERLEQYRLRKRRQQNWESFKERVWKFIMPRPTETAIPIPIENSDRQEEKKKTRISESDNDNEALLRNESDEESDIPAETTTALTPLNEESKLYKYTLRVVFFLFWVTLYIIAIELKFGIVYLMLSALVGICLNTRTGPKKPGEISAYSVFNENCESIDGTLKAEQFEKELFYKSALGK